MSKFKKKHVVNAWVLERSTYCINASLETMGDKATRGPDGCLIIMTREGSKIAYIGDYIIEFGAGDFYTCTPDVFKQTYESSYEADLRKCKEEYKESLRKQFEREEGPSRDWDFATGRCGY